jgi:hypothetical protein
VQHAADPGAGYAFNRSADTDTVREMKEKLCYVSIDPKREHKLAQVGNSHIYVVFRGTWNGGQRVSNLRP